MTPHRRRELRGRRQLGVSSSAAPERPGAFLAMRMNGEPLPPDHGAPLRLVVPGLVWLQLDQVGQRYSLVGADEPVTPQMMEFSLRTHQRAIPNVALDYEPPVDRSRGNTVRVEKRRVDGRLEYRIVGIVWGGERPVDRLMIRFRAGMRRAVHALPRSAHTSHLVVLGLPLAPVRARALQHRLTAADPAIRTRRLDVSFYVRRVVIDEV